MLFSFVMLFTRTCRNSCLDSYSFTYTIVRTRLLLRRNIGQTNVIIGIEIIGTVGTGVVVRMPVREGNRVTLAAVGVAIASFA
jgi:hypothetical protein